MARFFPPRFTHESFNEDLYEWSPRGVDDPHEHSWCRVFYTCKFCPGRGEEPDDIDHVSSCPVARGISAGGEAECQ